MSISRICESSTIYLNQLGELLALLSLLYRRIMSKTIRNERTRGFLDKLQRSRKDRKEIRALKADELFNIDVLFQEFTSAQEI